MNYVPDSNMNWFVAPNVKCGDGSREKPFHDPWQGFYHASPGDTIHLAAGTYFGRYDRSSWIVDSPSLTVRGGYSADFSTRAPWKTPSVLGAFRGYESTRENNLITGRGDHSGLVLDGLFFDASGQNIYDGKPGEGVRSYPTMAGAMASFSASQVTIRNCIFANGANGGVELSGASSCFENNLLLNMIGLSMLDLRSSPAFIDTPITARNNSFCFIHDVSAPPGAGADQAIGVHVHCPAIVRDNLFLSCGNAAISLFVDPGRVEVERNLFFMTPRDVLVSHHAGESGEITEKNLDDLDDLGFKSSAGNVIQNPAMTGLRADWLDTYSRHLMANYARPPRETVNAVRVGAGLDAIAPGEVERSGRKGDLAPLIAVADALALSFDVPYGFHSVELPTILPAETIEPAAAYRAVDWHVISAPDAALVDMRVELRAGLGQEQNSIQLTDTTPETHMGVQIFKPFSDDVWIHVLIRRHTLQARQFEEAIRYSRGLDVESTYLLRGLYRTDLQPSWRQKVTLLIESIIPAPLEVISPAERSEGRDWFVREGSSGGDGTREKPFRDPFQALDKAEGGDTIHVAGGEYFGKLHSGKWKISIRNLTLLGGYCADFTARDAWANPTRLLLTAEEKAKGPSDPILASEENSDGLVLDGFIFDGATWNTYSADGSLDLATSPLAPLVSLRGGRAEIVVRNCVFVNGSAAAINISCPYGTFENNIVLNTSGWAVKLTAEGPGPWTIRNNTLLFACDPTDRAGTGLSSADGTLLLLTGRAVTRVDSNIFAFADNFGVRAALPQQNVSFHDNVFAANLVHHLTDARYMWADSSSWERRAVADSAFAAFSGNTLELPKIPVDTSFADAVLVRLFTLPSRITAEQWKVLAGQIGSAAKPASPAEVSTPMLVAPAPQPVRPAASHATSITDLLAGLASMKAELQDLKPPKLEEVATTARYCPVFDWSKALNLANETSEDGPGARRRKIAVSFSAPQVRVTIRYTRVTALDIDNNGAALENQPIELDVTQFRDSSTNPSLFPAGTDKQDFYAGSVVTAEGSTRTYLAIVVRKDTAATKLLDRSTISDTLRIRGTAKRPGNSSALSIVVDSVELV